MTPPRRQLGIAVAAAIVIANMIGAGVFTSAGFQASSLHDPWTMLLTWVVGGVLALCGATCYAELGALMPRAGGEYVYLREAYHPAVGFMSGWVSLTAGFSAPIAAAALGFAAYLGKIVGFADGSVVAKLVATALVVAITSMHAVDTKLGGRVQTGFTVAKVVLIAGFVIAGLVVGTGDWGHLASQAPGLGQLGTKAGAAEFATSLMYVGFAYSGWNAAAYIAGELENPQRTLPRALVLGTAIVMVLYLALNVIFLYASGPERMAGKLEVGDLAARDLFGDSAGNVVSITISLALVSSVSAMVMAGPRVYAAMASDRALPRFFATFSQRGVPVVAVVAQCVIAVICVWIGDLKTLIEFAIFALWIFGALTVGAVFVFRRRGQVSPYRALGYPLSPILFIAISAWVVYLQASKNPWQTLAVAGLLVVGALLYLAANRGAPPHEKIEADE